MPSPSRSPAASEAPGRIVGYDDEERREHLSRDVERLHLCSVLHSRKDEDVVAPVSVHVRGRNLEARHRGGPEREKRRERRPALRVEYLQLGSRARHCRRHELDTRVSRHVPCGDRCTTARLGPEGRVGAKRGTSDGREDADSRVVQRRGHHLGRAVATDVAGRDAGTARRGVGVREEGVELLARRGVDHAERRAAAYVEAFDDLRSSVAVRVSRRDEGAAPPVAVLCERRERREPLERPAVEDAEHRPRVASGGGDDLGSAVAGDVADRDPNAALVGRVRRKGGDRVVTPGLHAGRDPLAEIRPARVLAGHQQGRRRAVLSGGRTGGPDRQEDEKEHEERRRCSGHKRSHGQPPCRSGVDRRAELFGGLSNPRRVLLGAAGRANGLGEPPRSGSDPGHVLGGASGLAASAG